MVENQHRLIAGYQDSTQQEIDLVNKIKTAESSVAQLWAEVETGGAGGPDTAEAKQLLRLGFSVLIRAVMHPMDPYQKAADKIVSDWEM